MLRTATVQAGDKLYLQARGSSELFDCPVLKLVRVVFQDHGPSAFSILRRPIALNFDPDPVALSLIQVMAKRWVLKTISTDIQEVPDGLGPLVLNVKQVAFHNSWIGKTLDCLPEALLQAEALVSLGEKRFNSSRPIATFLTDESYRILSVGWNLRSQNRLWHSELVALRFLIEAHRLDPFKMRRLNVVTSLQPCRLCAAYILATAEKLGAELTIRYLRPDKGPKAKNTGLEGLQTLI